MLRGHAKSWIWPLALVVVAIALRMPGMAGRGLWLDEAFCVRLAQFDWGSVIARAALDNHPPLFFAVLKLWMTVFGQSAFALRSLDLLLAGGTIVLVYALALRVLPARSPILGATLATSWLALHPTHVLWSAEVRMYALAALLAVASVLLLLRALDQPLSWRRWAAWTATAIALAYTHYYGAFIVLAQGVHALVCAVHAPERRASLVRVVASGAAVIVAFAPWLSVVLAQSETLRGHWWVPPLTRGSLAWTWTRVAGLIPEDDALRPTGLWAVVVGLLACAVALPVAITAVRGERALRLLAWCVVVPIAGGVAMTVALGENVVLARYLIVAQPFVGLVVIGWLFERASVRIALAALAPVAITVGIALVPQIAQLAPEPDVAAARAWIAERFRPGDVVVIHQFNYASFRIEDDPPLPIRYAGSATKILGGALIGDDDLELDERAMHEATGRVFTVDSEAMPISVTRRLRRVDGARFRVWMPPSDGFTLRVTEYTPAPRRRKGSD